jgi:hypothetical protein
MRGLPAIRGSDAHRTRRWDAVILGSAVPGLVAGILLGRHGRRVLVLEEESEVPSFAGLREPFFLTPAVPEEPLGGCLRALGIPLIDQRRIQTQPTAFQLILPEARIDVGAAATTSDELAGWGLADASATRAALEKFAAASKAAREALLAHPILAPGWRGVVEALRTGTSRATPRSAGALPTPPPPKTELEPGSPLALVLQATAAIASQGSEAVAPDALPALARARLLGAALAGSGRFESNLPRVRELLRRRLEALYGEIRPLRGPFELVRVSGQPGVATSERHDVCVGRALILNASEFAISRAFARSPSSGFLDPTPPAQRRVTLHWSAPRELVPDNMAPRVALLRDPASAPRGGNLVALQCFERRGERERVDLVASSIAQFVLDDTRVAEAEIEAEVQKFLPFFAGQLRREPVARCVWDSDDWLPAAPRGERTSWPDPIEIRRSRRPLVYSLARGELACLGFEGDLLLGWRAGNAIAADLE